MIQMKTNWIGIESRIVCLMGQFFLVLSKMTSLSIGAFEDEIEYEGKKYSSGIYNTIIEDSILIGNSYIMNNAYIRNTIIGEGCIVMNNQSIMGMSINMKEAL